MKPAPGKIRLLGAKRWKRITYNPLFVCIARGLAYCSRMGNGHRLIYNLQILLIA